LTTLGFNHRQACAIKRAGIVDEVGDGSFGNAANPIHRRSSAILCSGRGRGATLWFNNQGQAHIVSTATVLPGSGNSAYCDVEARP
jgi:hypothetical protein